MVPGDQPKTGEIDLGQTPVVQDAPVQDTAPLAAAPTEGGAA